VLVLTAGFARALPEPEVRIADAVMELQSESGKGYAYFTAFIEQ
jgi:hypothetical protein